MPSKAPFVRLRSGFTLLEVMIALAILGLSFVAIMGSQVGAVKAGARARAISTATLLARCKMAEVEEQMVAEGFPVVSADGDDECCEGGEQEGFSCHWSVERIVLPDPVDVGTDDPLAAAGGMTGDHAGDTASGMDVQNALAGAAGGDQLGQFAVQYSYPVIRPLIEDQVRRATVYVRWSESIGASERHGPCEAGERSCFGVVQYLVAEQGSSLELDQQGGNQQGGNQQGGNQQGGNQQGGNQQGGNQQGRQTP